jgi:hypothetical protein
VERDGRTIRLIFVSGKANYFYGEGLTRFRKIRPSGKSVVHTALNEGLLLTTELFSES